MIPASSRIIFAGDIAAYSRIAAAICQQIASLLLLCSDLGAGLFARLLFVEVDGMSNVTARLLTARMYG